jgi:putative sterol carrier protein
MSLEDIKTSVEQKFALAPAINAIIKVDLADNGSFVINAKQSPPVFIEDDSEVSLTLLCEKEVFEGILNGTQDPNIAYMMGKLKIEGSLGLAMKLNAVLED